LLDPDYYFHSVYDIPYQKFYNQDFRGIIFDVDNTLTAFDVLKPQEKTVALLNRLKHMGFQLFLLTNNSQKRLNGFNEELALPGKAMALKPFSWGVKRAMRVMKTTPRSTIIVGDQLLTDVWAGRNAKITTILIKPITDKDFKFVNFKRIIERKLLRKYFEGLK
jgi:HAD superfamily phosphatase (TIGR01668 family)